MTKSRKNLYLVTTGNGPPQKIFFLIIKVHTNQGEPDSINCFYSCTLYNPWLQIEYSSNKQLSAEILKMAPVVYCSASRLSMQIRDAGSNITMGVELYILKTRT